MDGPPAPSVLVTVVGAVATGLVAGALGVLLESGYGAALGVALALPLLVQFGWGFGEFDRGAYFAGLELEDVLLDAGAMVTCAAVVGWLSVTAVTQLGGSPGLEFAVGTGSAFAGGGGALLWLTGPYHAGRRTSER